MNSQGTQSPQELFSPENPLIILYFDMYLMCKECHSCRVEATRVAPKPMNSCGVLEIFWWGVQMLPRASGRKAAYQGTLMSSTKQTPEFGIRDCSL